MESWFWLALAAAAIWGATGIIDKLAVSRWLRSTWAYTLLFGIFDAVLVCILFAIFPIATPLPAAFLAGIASATATFLYIYALRAGEVSRIVPLTYSSPLFIALTAAVVLRESLGAVDYVGLVLIVAGAAALTLRKAAGHLRVRSVAALVLVASFIFAIAGVLLKYTTGSAGWLAVFSWFYLGGSVTYLIFSARHARELVRGLARIGPAISSGLVVVQALAVFAYLLLITAIAQGPVSLVAAINTVTPAFTLLYAILLVRWHPGMLEERFTKTTIVLKAAAIAAIIAGVYLIS